MIVHLHVWTLTGTMAWGAKHWYADLIWSEGIGPDGWNNRQTIRVLGRTSYRDAVILNRLEHNRDVVYKPGDVCFGWLTEKQATDYGKRKFKKEFDLQQDVLVLGDISSAEPKPILYGPQWLKGKIQAWYDHQVAHDWDYDLESVRAVGDEFWDFWKQYETTHTPRHVDAHPYED